MLGLKVQRVRLGMTQEQLAKALGVSLQTICHWETDNTQPTASGMKKLCDFFKCERKELF